MDGIFVPNTTFKFELASKLIETSGVPVDVHLMISEADSGVDPYLSTSALSLSVHFEALIDPKRTLSKIRDHGKRASLAIKPGTPIESISPYLNQVDMILIMTVEPGFGGQGFISDMLPKIKQARSWLDKNGFDIYIAFNEYSSPPLLPATAISGFRVFVNVFVKRFNGGAIPLTESGNTSIDAILLCQKNIYSYLYGILRSFPSQKR